MGKAPGQRTTLKDIAQKTGYSVNTVSRALRNKPDISVETREKIRELARSMGYHNNALASSLRLGRTKTIAVITPDISNLFFACALTEIERGAREQGYSTMLLNTAENVEYEENAIRIALEKNVDGIIFGPSQSSKKNMEMLLNSGTPFIQFARYFASYNADFVVADDKLGGYQATTHLIENGHRNILLLNGLTTRNTAAQGREAGYRHALEAAGIPVQPELIQEVSLLGNDSGQRLYSILQRRSDITAVFAYSDLVAFSVLEYLRQHDIQVPRDISIIGFDNIRAHIPIPYPLTTVDIKIREMAAIALDALLTKMDSDDSGRIVCQMLLQTDLAVGETVLDMRGK